jgi:tetratricopeptide (TPR) repeat protein
VERIRQLIRGEIGLGRIVDLPRRRRRRTAELVDLADRARDAGQWEVAAQLYRKALDRNPRNPCIWVQYGHALKESGGLRDPEKLAQAEAAYRRALSLDPGAADTYLQIGHVLKLQGKIEEAQAAFLRAFVLDSSMPHPLQELSGLGWSEAQTSELRGLVGSNLPPASSSTSPATFRKDARRRLKRLRLGSGRRTAELVDLADRARDAGQWEVAAQLYRKALDRNPRNPCIWVQYGHALKESGGLRDPEKLAQAEAAYRRALSFAPGVADTYVQLGHALKLQGKNEEAEASYLRAFALDPSMPYPLEELGGLGWSGAHLLELEEMLGSDVSNSRRFSPNDWSVSKNVNELDPQCQPSVEPCAAVSVRETEVDVPTGGGLTGETRSRAEPCGVSRSPVTILKSGNVFRLVYISGEPETPGHRYRVLRPMAAAKTLGAVVTWMQVGEIPTRLAEIEGADALIFWRVAWDEHIALAIDVARRGATKIVFDVDDLMIDPDLARLDIIDGIRTQGLSVESVRNHYERFRDVMWAADFCVTTTEELATHMRRALKPVVVQPNGFDYDTLAASGSLPAAVLSPGRAMGWCGSATLAARAPTSATSAYAPARSLKFFGSIRSAGSLLFAPPMAPPRLSMLASFPCCERWKTR